MKYLRTCKVCEWYDTMDDCGREYVCIQYPGHTKDPKYMEDHFVLSVELAKSHIRSMEREISKRQDNIDYYKSLLEINENK